MINIILNYWIEILLTVVTSGVVYIFKEIYINYHKLKGNGMATSMIDEINKLPSN